MKVSHKLPNELPPMPPTPSKGAGSRRKSSDLIDHGLHRPVVPIVPFPDIQRPHKVQKVNNDKPRRKRYSTNLVEIERNHGMQRTPSRNSQHHKQRSSPVILVSPSTISRSPSISTQALRAGKAYRREQDVYLCRPPSPSPTVTQMLGTSPDTNFNEKYLLPKRKGTDSGNMESSSNTITFTDPTRVYYTMPHLSATGTRTRNQSSHLLVMERSSSTLSSHRELSMSIEALPKIDTDADILMDVTMDVRDVPAHIEVDVAKLSPSSKSSISPHSPLSALHRIPTVHEMNDMETALSNLSDRHTDRDTDVPVREDPLNMNMNNLIRQPTQSTIPSLISSGVPNGIDELIAFNQERVGVSPARAPPMAGIPELPEVAGCAPLSFRSARTVPTPQMHVNGPGLAMTSYATVIPSHYHHAQQPGYPLQRPHFERRGAIDIDPSAVNNQLITPMGMRYDNLPQEPPLPEHPELYRSDSEPLGPLKHHPVIPRIRLCSPSAASAVEFSRSSLSNRRCGDRTYRTSRVTSPISTRPPTSCHSQDAGFAHWKMERVLSLSNTNGFQIFGRREIEKRDLRKGPKST